MCSGVGQRANLVLDALAQFLAGAAEIVFLLKAEPEFRTVPKVAGQTQRGIRGDGTTTRDDGRDPAVWDARIKGEAILRNVHLIEELGTEDFTGMGEVESLCFVFHFRSSFSWCSGSALRSVVVLDGNLVGVAIFPAEADAPLLVDADAELSFAVSLECFEAVRRRDAKVVEVFRLVQHRQLVQGTLLNLGRQFSGFQRGPQALRLLVSKAFDHIPQPTVFPSGVNNIYAKRS